MGDSNSGWLSLTSVMSMLTFIGKKILVVLMTEVKICFKLAL